MNYRKIIGFSLLLNALLAMLFGGLLMMDPSGSVLNFPLEWVSDTPFKNYFIPGLIWFIFNGLSSLLLSVLCFIGNKFYADLSIIQGGMLAGWLTLSFVFLKQFIAILHIPFFVIALLLIVLGIKALNVKS